MIIDVHPEFGYEIACAVPYANWLHQQGKLEKVVTCKGMSPYYFFTDNVEEKHTSRSLNNNNNGVQNLPNSWIHHNALANFGKDYGDLSEQEKIKANGWLDYSQWQMPDYGNQFYDKSFTTPDKFIVISNRYNLEHGSAPVGYFDIEALYEMFNELTNKGYSVIYKRPKNNEFICDSNEILNKDISARVIGNDEPITDYELTTYFENVHLIDEFIKDDYNLDQLKLFSKAEGFISMGGGSSILCSCFKKPVIIYVNTSKDVRPGYFDENSYFRKLSNAPIYPIIDKKSEILQRGYRDYNQVYETINKVFK